MIPMIGEFREKVKSSRDLLGHLVSIYDQSVAETLLPLHPDLLVVDMEHSVIDVRSLQSIVMASGETPILARIRGLEKNEIKKVLDTGVAGIIIPGIRTVEEAEQAVMFSKLPPEGIRGAGPGRASGYGYQFQDYAGKANKSLVIIQIETRKAFSDLEEILSVKGLDGYFIGPMDLSISLGMEYSWNNPTFVEAIDKVVREGKKRNLISGIYTPLNGKDFKRVKERGFNFIMFGSDRQAMTITYENSLNGYRDL